MALLHEKVSALRASRIADGQPPTSGEYRGVNKTKIREVLALVALGDREDLIDGVFALLDDQTDSWFPRAPAGTKICHGATTAHLGCHIGILQRGAGKLDREGRDYWIKPLRELGAIEPILLLGQEFIYGHPRAKSPNSCYRLAEDFLAILCAPEGRWRTMLSTWSQDEAARTRRVFRAEMEATSRALIDNGHSALISASVSQYAARFLPGYEAIYVDDGDGDRVTDDDESNLARANVQLILSDAMPDALLWNPVTDRLWVIEAVTSDGEVDFHKVAQLKELATRCGKAGIDFTTTYRTWKEAAARQTAHGNLAVQTYMWIQADPDKHFRVESFI
jgi:hypothetical protein